MAPKHTAVGCRHRFGAKAQVKRNNRYKQQGTGSQKHDKGQTGAMRHWKEHRYGKGEADTRTTSWSTTKATLRARHSHHAHRTTRIRIGKTSGRARKGETDLQAKIGGSRCGSR